MFNIPIIYCAQWTQTCHRIVMEMYSKLRSFVTNFKVYNIFNKMGERSCLLSHISNFIIFFRKWIKFSCGWVRKGRT